MEEFLRSLRKNIKILRTLKGYTQEEVADMILVSRSTYSAYETGRLMPNPYTLLRLAELYDVNIEYFYKHDLCNMLLHEPGNKIKSCHC